MLQSQANSHAVPVAEDISLPIDRLTDFLHQAVEAYARAELMPAFWGHAGDGVVRMQPVLDLAQIGHRQKLFKISDTLYKSALNMGGSISASSGDGRTRSPYMAHVYGTEAHKVMMQIKRAFDPHGILNRGVKTASAEEVKAMMRTSYHHAHHEHLPI